MEKNPRDALIEAGIELLGTEGSRGASARAAEVIAGLPHGSMRHHFGSQTRFLVTTAEALFERDLPRFGETEDRIVDRWVRHDATRTRARLELNVVATRSPEVAAMVRRREDRYVEHFMKQDQSEREARRTVRCLDGEALIRLLAS